MDFRKLLIAATATLVFAGPHAVFAADAPAMKSGDILVTHSGMTLYVFDKDQAAPGKSVCNGSCASNWPALTAPADAKATGDWSVVTRDDGTKQWAYKGRPVYQWAKDQKAGDRTGDGIGGAWHIVKD
jgi:predicted lipoprotein with Yx(FWY)xxD motif